MKYCTDCHLIFEDSEMGEKPETNKYEYWGANISHTDYIDCCPNCGSEDIEEAKICPCGEGIPPMEEFCENCIDNMADIVKDLNWMFKGIKDIDRSTVIEKIAEMWDESKCLEENEEDKYV